MTTIDAAAGIDIVWEQQQATVRIPLAGQASPQWFRRYRALARQQGLQAWAESHPSRGWVIVELPDGSGAEEITATLDAARELISEADAAGDPPGTDETDRVVRDWWAQQRGLREYDRVKQRGLRECGPVKQRTGAARVSGT